MVMGGVKGRALLYDVMGVGKAYIRRLYCHYNTLASVVMVEAFIDIHFC
jgi:hypothetical protein